MGQDFAKGLYNSKRWQRTRDAYKKSVGNLCERCLAKGLIVPAEIVHHKVKLTPNNIHDPDIALSFNNLEAVCRNCHAEIHDEVYQNKKNRRYFVEKSGRVVPRCDK